MVVTVTAGVFAAVVGVAARESVAETLRALREPALHVER
jgi:hypothetical protein